MTTRYDPNRPPGDLWDDLAKLNAKSAILYHATDEFFEESGRRDAEYLEELCFTLSRSRAMGGGMEFNVLDIGGGIGRIAKHLAPLVSHYYLLDASIEMLTRARVYLGDAVGNVTLFHGNGIDLFGVPDASIDFAFTSMVFQHLDREIVVRYLMDLPRVLKADGAAWLQVPAMSYPERFEDAQRGDWPANYRRWYPGEFLEVCIRCGLSVVAADLSAMEVVVRRAPDLTWSEVR